VVVMTHLRSILAIGGLLLSRITSAQNYTAKHEAGRCAIRGQCGSKSWFGKQLPCLDNGLAEEPDGKLRQSLVDLCGPKWSSGPVCCSAAQVREAGISIQDIPDDLILALLVVSLSDFN
jgi:Niemann-Pick C1 protein